MNIGNTILDIRKKRGLKQKELAQLLNIGVGYLSKIENGKANPSNKLLATICRKLNLPEDVLRILSYGVDDVPEDSKAAFEIMEDNLKDLVIQIFVQKQE